MSGHTPGPWIYRGPASIGGPCIFARVRDDKQWVVATCATSRIWIGPPKEFEKVETEACANARLIAAAPELLEACERVLRMWEWCVIEGGAAGPLAPHLIKELASMQNEICEQIQAAIKKAKGAND